MDILLKWMIVVGQRRSISDPYMAGEVEDCNNHGRAKLHEKQKYEKRYSRRETDINNENDK